MTYHNAHKHPKLRLLRGGLRGLGAIDQPATGSFAGMYVTSLTPYDVSPVQAQFVPQALIDGMYGAGYPRGYVWSGWSDAGHIWLRYQPKIGWTAAQRRAALTQAVRAAERTVGGGAKFLLPGESAPAGATPTTAPVGTPTDSTVYEGARVNPMQQGQTVPTSDVQTLLISKGYTLAGGADGTFGTSTASALRLALVSIARYVVLGGVVTTYTPSADKRSIAFSSGTWEALQNAPQASGGGRTTPTPADLTMTDTTDTSGGTGVDMGTLLPWLAVGAGVLAIGGYFYYQSKKGGGARRLTVKNGRRTRRVRANHSESERELWLINDEGLYNWWKSSRMSKRKFIREHKEEIDAAIDRVLGGGAHRQRQGRFGMIGNGRRVKRNVTGYELVYSTGGHGGPYPSMQAAKTRAEKMLKGGRDRWIAVVPANQIVDLNTALAAWIVRRDPADRVEWEQGPRYLPSSRLSR